jgi:hypothetical protein
VKTIIWGVALAAVLLATGCGGGQSASDKANSQVCDAKADISKQIDTLKSMTASTFTVSGVQNALKAIQADLSSIASAQGQLSPDRKQQVQSANATFSQSLTTALTSLATSLSAQDAATQVQAALATLASSYEQAFSAVSC